MEALFSLEPLHLLHHGSNLYVLISINLADKTRKKSAILGTLDFAYVLLTPRHENRRVRAGLDPPELLGSIVVGVSRKQWY